ncbi:hypothetical protein BGY98DRAFT_636854 [Russula aff. rugulosa BPL654]|nr:hypothetical protein BGY98DRAFT_636854 [Russula aff. rugulosa BPL654]
MAMHALPRNRVRVTTDRGRVGSVDRRWWGAGCNCNTCTGAALHWHQMTNPMHALWNFTRGPGATLTPRDHPAHVLVLGSRPGPSSSSRAARGLVSPSPLPPLRHFPRPRPATNGRPGKQACLGLDGYNTTSIELPTVVCNKRRRQTSERSHTSLSERNPIMATKAVHNNTITTITRDLRREGRGMYQFMML